MATYSCLLTEHVLDSGFGCPLPLHAQKLSESHDFLQQLSHLVFVLLLFACELYEIQAHALEHTPYLALVFRSAHLRQFFDVGVELVSRLGMLYICSSNLLFTTFKCRRSSKF